MSKSLVKRNHIPGMRTAAMFIIVSLVALVILGCGAPPTSAAEAAGDLPESDGPAPGDYDYWPAALDTEYDDSWVENVPDVIGGYKVLYITTPKDLTCASKPRIGLEAKQKSLDEFLIDAPGPEVFAMARSLPGVPSNVGMSFSYSSTPFSAEERDARRKRWNARNLERGHCIRWGRPSGSVHIEIEDSELPVKQAQ